MRQSRLAPAATLAALVATGWILASVFASGVGSLLDELVAWDGSWYALVASDGYRAAPTQAIRFFPLYPAAGSALSVATGMSIEIALITIAAVSTVLGIEAVRHLARVAVPDDDGLRNRSAWAAALAPAGVSLVLAYPTGLSLTVSCLALAGIVGRRWAWAGGWAFVAALLRPTGVLLAVPLAIGWWRDGRRAIASLSVAAPVVGLVAVGSHSRWATGSWRAFVDEQSPLRGEWVDPVTRMLRGGIDLAGSDVLDGLHLPFATAILGLAFVAWRLLPLEIAAHTLVVALVVVSVENWNSIERYVYDAPGLLIAAAVLIGRRRVAPRLVAVAAGSCSVVITALVMAGEFVP